MDGVADGFDWYVSEGGHDQAALDLLHEAEAMLMGRKTYEGARTYLAHGWPRRKTVRAAIGSATR